jgi:hypothetical protein
MTIVPIYLLSFPAAIVQAQIFPWQRIIVSPLWCLSLLVVSKLCDVTIFANSNLPRNLSVGLSCPGTFCHATFVSVRHMTSNSPCAMSLRSNSFLLCLDCPGNKLIFRSPILKFYSCFGPNL